MEVREDGRVRFLAAGRQMEITFTHEKDSARFTCIAKNIAGQAKADYNLLVMSALIDTLRTSAFSNLTSVLPYSSSLPLSLGHQTFNRTTRSFFHLNLNPGPSA